MNKWITVKKEYKNEGIELDVSCERANIFHRIFVTWEEELDGRIEELINEIEEDVIGDVFNSEELQFSHYSNKNLDDLVVTLIASYPPLNLSSKVTFDSTKKQHESQKKVQDNLMELIWNTQLTKREQKS